MAKVGCKTTSRCCNGGVKAERLGLRQDRTDHDLKRNNRVLFSQLKYDKKKVSLFARSTIIVP